MIMLLLMLFMSLVAGKEVFRNDNDEEKKVWKAEMVTDKMRRHCSSPSGEYMMFRLFKSLLLGSVDGKILVEDDGGQMSDFIRSGRLVSERLCATSSNQRQAPCQEQLR